MRKIVSVSTKELSFFHIGIFQTLWRAHLTHLLKYCETKRVPGDDVVDSDSSENYGGRPEKGMLSLVYMSASSRRFCMEVPGLAPAGNRLRLRDPRAVTLYWLSGLYFVVASKKAQAWASEVIWVSEFSIANSYSRTNGFLDVKTRPLFLGK